MYSGAVRRVSRKDIKLVTVSLEMEETNLNKECLYAGDVYKYISCLNADKKPLHDVLGFRKEINGTTVDIALQWCVGVYSNKMLGYVNSIRTIDGGIPIDGVKASITRTLNSLAKKLKLIEDKDIILSEEHVMEGLTCMVSVIVPKLEFESQTPMRVGNSLFRAIIDHSIQEYLVEYFELHPDVLESIISKSFNAYKRARDLLRSESVSMPCSIPKKLTSSFETSDIFIGRGDSSGGAAKPGLVRRSQSKRTQEQPWSDDAVATAPGESLENTSDSSFKKRNKKPKSCVPTSHTCISSRQIGANSIPPNPKDGNNKTPKDVTLGSSNKTRPVIPVGPGFQAEIPVWIAPTKKGKFYGSPGDSDTLRWLGTGVWPTYTLKKEFRYNKIGEGRSDYCSCASPGSTSCIKRHIKIARELLEKEITRAFYTWKFDQMSEEVVSKSWTAKEEQRFEALVKKNPGGFWESACNAFPRKSEKDLISYYHNVFLIKRMRLLANSDAANLIDSDDELYDDFLAVGMACRKP